MKQTNKDNKNVNYDFDYGHLAEVESAMVTIILSVTVVVFMFAFAVHVALNPANFITDSDRAGMMFFGMGWGIIASIFVQFFVDAWKTIRRIQDEELEAMVQFYFNKKDK